MIRNVFDVPSTSGGGRQPWRTGRHSDSEPPAQFAEAVSRRRALALAVSSALALLLPGCRDLTTAPVAGDPLLSVRVLNGLGEKVIDLLVEQIERLRDRMPSRIRREIARAIRNQITEPTTNALAEIVPPDEVAARREELERAETATANFLADWIVRFLTGDNVRDAVSRHAEAQRELSKPTFRPPPQGLRFDFDFGTPRPTLDQSIAEIVETKRIDPRRLELEWTPIQMTIRESRYHRLRAEIELEAKGFLDEDFRPTRPTSWNAKANLDYLLFQNGARKRFRLSVEQRESPEERSTVINFGVSF